VVEANLLAVKATEARGEVINVACGEHVTVNEVIREINHALRKHVKAAYAPPRPGDIRDSWADITLAGQVIGYRPVVSFAAGLRRTIDWYVKEYRA